MPGTLYVIATPIGNLEDMTLRGLRLLKEADLIAAEDTRHTRKLLAHFQIETPLIAYHQHSEAGRVENLIRRLVEEDQTIAVVTDAGTPGVSDPGGELVGAALKAGVTVVPIPGASAALCALVASGLPTARFAFEGFLPRTKPSRRSKLAALATESRSLIFYEAPNRTAETLREMAGAFGTGRPAAVGRELTKKFEEFVRGTLGEVAAHFAAVPPRGEITIVIAPHQLEIVGESQPISPAIEGAEAIPAALAAAIAAGMTDRDAVRHVSLTLKQSRRDIYAAMLLLKNSDYIR